MASLSTPISYHRLMRYPLDDMEVFESVRDLMNYCSSGARYDGQRVVVLDKNKAVEYTIKNSIPLINLRGSEPIFINTKFIDDTSYSHGLLIYYSNNSGVWNDDDVYTYEENKLCLFNQLEIFRILNASGGKIFKFYIERFSRYTDEVQSYSWQQNYNPYDDGLDHIITQSGVNIESMAFNPTEDASVITNVPNIYIMPKTTEAANAEKNIITKIYIKAEDYYNAWV